MVVNIQCEHCGHGFEAEAEYVATPCPICAKATRVVPIKSTTQPSSAPVLKHATPVEEEDGLTTAVRISAVVGAIIFVLGFGLILTNNRLVESEKGEAMVHFLFWVVGIVLSLVVGMLPFLIYYKLRDILKVVKQIKDKK